MESHSPPISHSPIARVGVARFATKRDPAGAMMRCAAAVGVFCLLLPLLFQPGSSMAAPGAQDTGDLAARIGTLIRDLGDGSYKVRQAAASELRKIGYPAVSALEAAAKSDDPEVAALAAAVLKDARLGVTPAWPESIVKEVRRYDTLAAAARNTLIRRIVSEVKADAVPFLLARLGSGDKADGESVCGALKECSDDGLAARMVELLKEPRNEWQARALAWAYQCRKQPQEALRVLVSCRVEGEPRQSVIEQAVKDLIGWLKAKDYDEAAKIAAGFAQAAPAEARLLYLHAAALRRLGSDKEAGEIEGRAIELNPGEESPHYTAGEMLMELGMDDLSRREWEAILKIAPADDVYDINAWMRLAQLAERGGRRLEAAKCYETGLNLFRKKKEAGHGGYGMTVREDVLEALIRKLRQKGEAGDAAADPDGREVSLSIKAVVKDGRQKELVKALVSSTASIVMKTEPLGIRLMDLKECRLAYDTKAETVSILLGGSEACKPRPCPLGGKKTRIAIIELDCVHIIEIDPDSGEVKKLDRFEKDYEIKVTLGERLSGCKGLDLRIGDKTYPWKDLIEGTRVDYLPPVLELQMEGPVENGAAKPLKFEIPIDEKNFESAP